jgi:hypothetical protein
LAHPQDFHEITDADLFIGNEIEKSQARSIGQGAKKQIEGEWLLFADHGAIVSGLTGGIKLDILPYIRLSICVVSGGIY